MIARPLQCLGEHSPLLLVSRPVDEAVQHPHSVRRRSSADGLDKLLLVTALVILLHEMNQRPGCPEIDRRVLLHEPEDWLYSLETFLGALPSLDKPVGFLRKITCTHDCSEVLDYLFLLHALVSGSAGMVYCHLLKCVEHVGRSDAEVPQYLDVG